MKNIEIKIRVENFRQISNRLRRVRAQKHPELRQIDTYFKAPGRRRLKLREINGKEFQLIYYKRPDRETAKVSDYEVIPIPHGSARALKSVFAELFGVSAVVRKKRDLWTWNNTRIHLDRVRGLGFFVELETVIKSGQAQARRENGELIRMLGLSECYLLAGSYGEMRNRAGCKIK